MLLRLHGRLSHPPVPLCPPLLPCALPHTPLQAPHRLISLLQRPPSSSSSKLTHLPRSTPQHTATRLAPRCLPAALSQPRPVLLLLQSRWPMPGHSRPRSGTKPRTSTTAQRISRTVETAAAGHVAGTDAGLAAETGTRTGTAPGAGVQAAKDRQKVTGERPAAAADQPRPGRRRAHTACLSSPVAWCSAESGGAAGMCSRALLRALLCSEPCPWRRPQVTDLVQSMQMPFGNLGQSCAVCLCQAPSWDQQRC